MSKIKINSKIENKEEKKEYEINGIFKDNVLTFYEDNYKVNLYLFDNKLIMRRENKNFKYELIFQKNKKNKSSYHIKELNTYIDIVISTIELIIDDYFIKITYDLFMGEEKTGRFTYALKWSE